MDFEYSEKVQDLPGGDGVVPGVRCQQLYHGGVHGR